MTAGKGPLLVLLHGWGLNSRVWDPVLPQLGRRFTTVCLDLPGHGASPWPPGFHDIDSLADPIIASLEAAIDHVHGRTVRCETTAGMQEVEQRREQLPRHGRRSDSAMPGGDGCFVVGWSLGAMAAIAAAARRRGLVRRLVLVAATPKFVRAPDWPHAVEQSALNDMAGRLLGDFHATVRDFLLWQVHGDENAREALRLLRAKIKAGGEARPEALSAGLQVLAMADLRPRLPALDVPTLVIAGERDRLSHPQAGAALASALPQARLRIVERAAHAPFLSHPEEFCADVAQFLAA